MIFSLNNTFQEPEVLKCLCWWNSWRKSCVTRSMREDESKNCGLQNMDRLKTPHNWKNGPRLKLNNLDAVWQQLIYSGIMFGDRRNEIQEVTALSSEIFLFSWDRVSLYQTLNLLCSSGCVSNSWQSFCLLLQHAEVTDACHYAQLSSKNCIYMQSMF